MNLAVDFLAGTVDAIVSDSRDDHDAGIDQLTDRAADRIVNIRIDRRRADAHVHDLNIVSIPIRDDPIEGRQHRRHLARAVSAQDPEID